jgi:hypothetical protein
MAFVVPKSKKSIKQNKFEFDIDGVTYSVPLIKFLPIGVVEKFGDDGLTGILSAFDGAAAKAVRTLDGEQFEALSNAWTEASGVDTGESSASAS